MVVDVSVALLPSMLSIKSGNRSAEEGTNGDVSMTTLDSAHHQQMYQRQLVLPGDVINADKGYLKVVGGRVALERVGNSKWLF